MTEGLSAPHLEFVRCPPGFRQTRQTMVPAGARPFRRPAPPLRLVIPPRPQRPARLSLRMRFREAWQAALPHGLGLGRGWRLHALGEGRH